MKRIGLALWCSLILPAVGLANGVSPYLPLNLEPEIESQIERVLILAGMPVMTRPIAAASVLEALPKACRIDQALCRHVERYLTRYTHTSGITDASLEGAVSSGQGAGSVDPDRYGMRENSRWDASAQAYVQPSAYLLVDVGAVGYEGRTNFTGSMISLGFDKAQLDLGFRPHWFSPMSDSSMLMSTEAPTMPSATLSNYQRVTRLNLHYELFAAQMSSSNRIVLGDGFTSGHPRLAGLHLDMEPVSGWALGINRLMQYGGGAYGGSIHDLVNAFFNPAASQTSNIHKQIGNQEASFTSTVLFPARIPFAFYLEYAGEDTSRGKNYLLGNSALSAGIHFPRLGPNLDLTLEVTEWQNLWYTHTVYLDGMTNDGLVTGNWFGDQRVFGNSVGGHSGMASLGWQPPFGGLLQLRYRTLQNADYSQYSYDLYHDVSLAYSRPWKGVVLGGQLDEGHDVFGASYLRLAGFVRYDENGGGLATSIADALVGSGDGESAQKVGELFVDAGANVNREKVDLTVATNKFNTPVGESYHFAIGARRFVSDHSDLGARVEFDGIQGSSMIGFRALDYRYRFNGPLTLGFFLGPARYALATPAYGIYYGIGTQWRNVLPGWDLNFDVRYYDSIARDHLLPSDPVSQRPDSFYDVTSATLSISRHFDL